MRTRTSDCPACGNDLGLVALPSPGDEGETPACPACGHGQWFRIEEANDVLVVHLQGRGIVTEQNVMRVLERVRDLISSQGRGRVLIDFEGVTYLSSTILARLINLARFARERPSQLKLCNLSPDVQDIFRITRLEGFFEKYRSRDEAISSF